MSKLTTFGPGCLSRLFTPSRFKAMPAGTSSTFSTPAKLIAQISAAGLVIASAGFGAVYAWTTGEHHGFALACLMVLMAVALELAKPLSIAAALAAFRRWSVVRGALLALLAVFAIGYSLTAELSLMATSRGDGVASREVAIKVANDIEIEAQRVRDRYERAKAEYQTLPVSRPSRELQAEIDGLLLTPGADGCTAIDGRVTREICPKVSALKAEKARADRRAELQEIMSKPIAPVVPQSSESIGAIGKADAGASALSAYLAVFGIAIAPAVLSEWLVLVGVLALEVGSAIAGVLVQSLAGPPSPSMAAESIKAEVVQQPLSPKPIRVVHPEKAAVSADADHARERVKTAIVDQLKAQGGSVSSGERGLAKLIGANRSTMRRAINGLVMAGVVVAEATRNGTMLRLVA